RLRSLVELLLGVPRVSLILVRPHPTNLWTGLDAWIAARNDRRLRRASGGSVSLDLEASDVVLAGNSSVLVEAVTAGRPGGYVSDLGYGFPGLDGVLGRGLVFPTGDELRLDPGAKLRFFRPP